MIWITIKYLQLLAYICMRISCYCNDYAHSGPFYCDEYDHRHDEWEPIAYRWLDRSKRYRSAATYLKLL